MVEVEDHRIIFAATLARVLSQVFIDMRPVSVLTGQCAAPAKVLRSAAPMAVRAHYVALGDLLRGRFPGIQLAHQVANVVSFLLRLAMIELQNNEIANAAVHALAVPEEFRSLSRFRAL
jgi:hypothetical protein